MSSLLEGAVTACASRWMRFITRMTSQQANHARSKVYPVAVSLVVVALLGLTLDVVGSAYHFSIALSPGNTSAEYWIRLSICSATHVLYCVPILLGAMSMLRLKSYLLAVVAACLATIPMFGPCYILAIPLGMWGLLTLRSPLVRCEFGIARLDSDSSSITTNHMLRAASRAQVSLRTLMLITTGIACWSAVFAFAPHVAVLILCAVLAVLSFVFVIWATRRTDMQIHRIFASVSLYVAWLSFYVLSMGPVLAIIEMAPPLSVYLLDTGHVGIIQRQTAPEFSRLLSRLSAHDPTAFYVSIISFHEQVAGWNVYLNRARSSESVVRAYEMFQNILRDFATMAVAPFDKNASEHFRSLRAAKVRVATMDLRIAAIALANNWTFLTRNTVDFAHVPELSIEDWTV